jgi:hypothetical protein
MIATLIRWLRHEAVRVVGRWLAGPPREPAAEDDRGAGI